MPDPVASHYDQLLGAVYSWSLGEPAAVTARAESLLSQLPLPAPTAGLALDLGCGAGTHTLALAQRGFRVVSMDTCATLLDELRTRVAAQPIRIVQGDLLGFARHITEPVALIACLGDTLCHLPDRASLQTLFADCARLLTAPGSMAVFSLRDYRRALEGPARFIPVRSEPDRILTCFLEYQPETVMVHDLLHTRTASGWSLKASAYPKLRLSPDEVAGVLSAHGFTVQVLTPPQAMPVVAAVRA
jgi:SAM-dependent methyltransferase